MTQFERAMQNQKSPQSSSATNNSEKSAGYINALLFDNLVCKFIFVQRSGKERCMSKGTISELQHFVSLVLEFDGYWSTGKDPNHNMFKSTCKNMNINYWISTQTFTVNGKKRRCNHEKNKAASIFVQESSQTTPRRTDSFKSCTKFTNNA